MTTGWPIAADSLGPISRARMSEVPPGANGTTMRTALSNCWAWAAWGTSAAIAMIDAAAQVASTNRLLSNRFIFVSSGRVARR